MSERLRSNNRSSDDVNVDETMQRVVERFAMPDLSVDPELPDSSPPVTPGGSTEQTFAKSAFDSLPAYDSTTALGEAFSKAEATKFSDEDIDASEDVEASG